MEKTLSLSDIRKRKQQLTREAEEARARLAEIGRQAAMLDAAEQVVMEFGLDVKVEGLEAQSVTVLPGIMRKTQQIFYGGGPAVPVKQPTIKTMILIVLRQILNVWTDASEIQTRVSEMKGDIVPMSTISPYLTELKNEKVIVRNGMKIALAERVENEAPSGSAAGASEAGGAATPSNHQPERTPVER